MEKENFKFYDNWTSPEGKKMKHVYTLDGKLLQGVTSVLGIIAKPALIQWAANLATARAFELADKMGGSLGALVGDIQKFTKIDTDAVKVLDAFPEFREARTVHAQKRDKAADQGTDTHAEIEEYVKNCIVTNGGYPIGLVKESRSLKAFTTWAINNQVKFIESEKQLFSKEWMVAGTCDLVFSIGSKTYVGDVKTMGKLWDNTPFIQCGAYAKMLRERGYEFQGTMIINIPKESDKAEIYERYDLDNDIKTFEAALLLYRTINK